MLNDEEAMQLTNNNNLEEIADKFLTLGPKIVIIKMGGNGALVAHNNYKNYVSIVPNTEVLDPTGAGDSFAGGVLGYIANYGMKDPVKAVIHGTAVASYTVSGFGLENLCQLNQTELNKKINQISFK
jgi:sugar/nucleoside kinase (ribokinase family)